MDGYYDAGPGLSWVMNVIVVLTVVPTLFWVGRLFWRLYLRQRERERILDVGRRATGRILAVQPTGTSINEQPEVNVWLQVFPPDGQTYQAQLVTIVPLFEIPRYQPGASIEVLFDPADPAKVAIAPQPLLGASASWSR